MTIELDLDELTERGRMLLLKRANEWRCTPTEAMARILDEDARKARVSAPKTPESSAA
jgi:hypothetical protein